MVIIKILIFHSAVCCTNIDYFRIYCFITLIAIIYTYILYNMECQWNVLFFPVACVFSDSVGVDDYIHLGLVVSQCVWWYDGFYCVETTVN